MTTAANLNLLVGATIPSASDSSHMSLGFGTDGLLRATDNSGNVLQPSIPKLTTAGSSNTYTATPAPAWPAYMQNWPFLVQFNAGNTGAGTLNVSGLGAKNLVLPGGGALTSGLIVANGIYWLCYDGTNLEVLGLASGTYLPIVGGTMRGDIAMGTHKITGLAAAANPGDAVRYEQLPLTGGIINLPFGTAGHIGWTVAVGTWVISYNPGYISGLVLSSANGATDSVTKLLFVPTTKQYTLWLSTTYTVAVGKFNVYLNGVQVGSTVDEYSTVDAHPTLPFDLGTLTAGIAYTIAITCVGKNPSSTGYVVALENAWVM